MHSGTRDQVWNERQRIGEEAADLKIRHYRTMKQRAGTDPL